MRHILIPVCTASVLLAALGLAACDGEPSVRISSSESDTTNDGVLKVVSDLQCPETQGELTRKGSAQAEGAICTYSGPRGTEVTLHLIKLDGGAPAEVLTAFENQLKRDLPGAAARVAGPATPAPPEGAGASTGGDRTEVDMPGVSIRSDGDSETVHLPGIHIESAGDRSSVRIGGLRIESGEDSADVAVTSEDDSVTIQAHDDAAEIRTRANGEAVRTTYILTDGTPSDGGWRMVGYEARGPAGGPLVVATIRSKDRDKGSAFEDAKDLVTLNVGE